MLKYRAQTYGRELRAYQNELAQAAALHQRAVSTRRGRIVFIAGQPKSGRTDMLVSLAQHLAQLKPAAQIIAGAFHSHVYYPATREFLMTELGAAVGETLALAAKLIPSEVPAAAADFVGQLLQAGSAAQTARAEADRPHDWQDEIKRFVRQAARTQPVAYFVDNLDHAGDLWLPWMLQDLATEIDRDLPLLVFITLNAPVKLGEARDDEPILWKAARGLLERGVAEWWPLTPLTRAEVAAYIGNAHAGIVEHLHQVTGGFPRRVVELWHDWQAREVVWWSDADDEWQFDKTKRPRLNLVKDVIDDRLKNIFSDDDHESLKLARDVLAYGALAGEAFAADAVAQALNFDRDDLIDFIDDELLHSEENPNGLLLEAEALPFTTEPESQRPVWRYRFANDLFWLANFEYGLTESELPKASAALFDALQEVYGNQTRLIAGDLARLCRNSGAHDTAQHFQRMWDHGTAIESMRQQGLLMAQVDKTDWSYWQKWIALDLLIQAGDVMVQSTPVGETTIVLTEALRLAAEIKLQPKQAYAGCLLGTTQKMSGDYEQATTLYNEALTINRVIGNRSGESACLEGLARVALERGDYERATEFYDEGLTINRAIENQSGESVCLEGLADVARLIGEYERAAMLYDAALTINSAIGNWSGEAVCKFGLAEVALERGYYERATEFYDEALAINRAIGRRSGESACLEGLARVALQSGYYERSTQLYDEALTINRAIGDRFGESKCLYGLATLAPLRGDYERADNLYRQSLALFTELGLPREQAFVIELLAELAKRRESAE